MADISASQQIERRVSTRRSILSVLGIAAVAVLLDQIAKAWALRSLVPGEPVPVLGDLIQLRLVFNPGAAFSMGEEYTWLFTVLAVIVSAVVIWMARALQSGTLMLLFGMFLGGVGGNLVDRLIRDPGFARGHVVDFLQLKGFAIVNIADIMLTFSVIGLVLVMLLRPKEIDEVSHPEAADQPAHGEAFSGDQPEDQAHRAE